LSNKRTNNWRLSTQRIVSIPFITDIFSSFIHYVDLFSFRISGGRFSLSGFLTGWPVITLITIGAKSGLQRTLPLLGIEDGTDVVLIASNFGHPNNPSWFYNLMKNPEVKLVKRGKEGIYIARQAEGEEYSKYWKMAVETNLGFSRYKERAKSRIIPIIVLSPKDNLEKKILSTGIFR